MKPMLDSLNLAGDDARDLERSLEDAFEVSFADLAEPCVTVGDVHARLLDRFNAGAGEGRCATSMAFYRLRNALAPLMPGRRITPDTPLRLAGGTPKALTGRLGEATGLRLHVGYAGWLTLIGLASVPLSLLLGAVLHDDRWLLLATGLLLLRFDTGMYGKQTVGELARQVAVNDFGRLAREGADHRPERVWQVLLQIIGDVAEVDEGRIGRQTRLFPATP